MPQIGSLDSTISSEFDTGIGLKENDKPVRPGKSARTAGVGRRNSRGVKGPYDFVVMKDIADLVNADRPLPAGTPISQNAKYQGDTGRDKPTGVDKESPSYRVPSPLLQLRRYESDRLAERTIADYSPPDRSVDTRRTTKTSKDIHKIIDSDQKDQRHAYPLPDFQLHLDVPNGDNITELLRIIDQDLSSQSFIHDWDRKLLVDPVKSLLSSVRGELSGYPTKNDGYILNHSIVDRVCTVNGVNHRRYLATGYHDVSNHLLPANVS